MKRLWILTAALFLIAAGVGIYCRTSYTRIDPSDKEQLGDFLIYTVSEEHFQSSEAGADIEMARFFAMGLDERVYTLPERSDYVLKVKCMGAPEFYYISYGQEVLVEEVFSGSGLKENEVIQVVAGGGYREPVHLKSEYNSYNAFDSCVNFMQEGEEYLIFLRDIQDQKYPGMYAMVDEVEISYFNLRDCENVLAGEDQVSYSQVSENEFFVKDQAALDLLQQVKTTMLEQYLAD